MEDDYRDISEVSDEVKLVRKASLQEMHSAIVNLTKLINDMLVMFKTASEQMNLEEKDNAHFKMIEKLDKILDENRTIAQSLVAMADMIKDKDALPKKPEIKPELFKIPESRPPPIQPSPSPIMQPTPMPSFRTSPPAMPPPSLSPPPMAPQPARPTMTPTTMYPPPSTPPPVPDFDIPELDEPFPFKEEKKKKGLFGRMKK